MENKQKPNYSFSPILVLATIILNLFFIFSRKNLSASPSLGYYILFFSGMALTLFLTIRVDIDLFRYAGDHPWYMKYFVLYLNFFSLAYLAYLII